MGNCVSLAPEGVPECSKCHKKGSKVWHDMTSTERLQWVWVERNAPCLCRGCHLQTRVDKTKYEKERAYYKQYKEQAYPKTAAEPQLHRIGSKETWAGTRSFYASWRPPSKILQLFEAMGLNLDDGNASKAENNVAGGVARKGTGFVGDTSGGGGSGHGGTQQFGGVEEGGDAAATSHSGGLGAVVEDLDEEGELVEVESIPSGQFALQRSSMASILEEPIEPEHPPGQQSAAASS